MARESRIAKLATSIVTLPITVGVVLFAVSNRNIVEVQFWPLPGTLDLPLYVIGLVTMVVGFLIGGMIAWLGASESRHRARVAERDIRNLETKLSDAQSETEKARAVAPPAKIAAE